MPLRRLIRHVGDLGERLKFVILCDKWFDVFEIVSEVGFEKVFDDLQLGRGGVQALHSRHFAFEFVTVEEQ